jgi:outer membrane protein TolC
MGKKPPLPQEFTIQEPAPLPPLTLRDCYELALKRSETVAIRKEDIETAEAQFFKATGEAVGDVNFVMTDFRQDAPKPSGMGEAGVTRTFSLRHRRERQFVITQPLFQGFKSLGALAGAGSLKIQRQQERFRAEQLLFLDVVLAFYDVMRYKKDVEIIQGIHQLFQERIDELRSREKIGRSRPSEVVNAKARMRLTEADLAQSQGALKVAQYILEFLTGIPIDIERLKEEDLETAVAQNSDDLLQAVKIRPDVKAARYAVKTAGSNVIVAQSGLWPEISLENNQYIRREGFQKDFDWDLLFTIDIPLFRGGQSLGEIKESVSEWNKAKYSYSLTERRAELEIKDAYQNWMTSVDRSKSLELAVKESEENYNLQRDEYARNLVSNLDVLAALESLNETRRDANQVYYEMKVNYWHLKVAQGEVL